MKHRHSWRRDLLVLLAVSSLSLPSARHALAETVRHSMDVVALLGDGSDLHIGTLSIEAAASNSQEREFELDLDPTVFTEKFLSMRPFKCIDGPDESVCHLPYPYENRQIISDDDLTDLEYALLFIFKTPQQYHAEFYNGLYFRLQAAADGFKGRLYEVNMDLLMTPPEAGNLRPIRPTDLVETEHDSHWLRGLEIR